MKTFINTKNIKYVLLLGIILSGIVSSIFIYNLKLEELIKQIPSEVIIANTSATQVQIFWKIPTEKYQIVSYREKTSTAPYKKFINVLNFKDNISNKNVFIASLTDLKPDTTYSLRFESTDKIWDRGYEFKTDGINQKVELPNIIGGDSNIDTLILIQRDDGSSLILDSEDYGTWAFDSKGKSYQTEDYAQISSEEKLSATLRRYLVPYAYALSGANCQTNITIKNLVYEPVNKERVARKSGELARLPGGLPCMGGHYVNECYEDVYCTAVERGIDPGFVFSIWYSETASSNYAAYGSTTRDFGINKSELFTDFAGQLDWLTDKNHILNMEYIAGCNDPNFSNETKWAAKYAYGNCKDQEKLVNGNNYYSKINRNYNGILTVTNKNLLFPFHISPNPSACDRSKQETNGVYRDCNGNTSGSNTPGKSGSDGVDKDEMIVTNTNRECVDSNGCICIYGSQRINASYAQTCTTDKRVIDTTGDPNTCWYVQDKVCKSTKDNCAKISSYPTEALCKANLSSASNTGNKPSSSTTTQQQVDPSVNCSGPDKIPGKFDIKIGEVCKDVGGCECFKGDIQPANHIKDVQCGFKCVEGVLPGQKPELVVTNEDMYCTNPTGCTCYWDNKSTKKEAENGYTCKVDKTLAKTEKVCCLRGENLTAQMPYNCQSTIIPDIEEMYCRTEKGKYSISKGVNFIRGVKTLETSTLKFQTAYDLIKLSNQRIITIGFFRDNSWKKAIQLEGGSIKGSDFKIEPGESYFLVSVEEFELPYTGYSAQPPKIDKMVGWNLVPISIFNNQVYSSMALLKNLNFNSIYQVAQWSKEKGLFEYTFRDKDNSVFGEDLKIAESPALFIKVKQ